jgi:8-oxo-dGTP diphosphatase
MACYAADHRGELVPASEIAEIAWVTGADLDQVSLAEQQVMAILLATTARPPIGLSLMPLSG